MGRPFHPRIDGGISLQRRQIAVFSAFIVAHSLFLGRGPGNDRTQPRQGRNMLAQENGYVEGFGFNATQPRQGRNMLAQGGSPGYASPIRPSPGGTTQAQLAVLDARL